MFDVRFNFDVYLCYQIYYVFNFFYFFVQDLLLLLLALLWFYGHILSLHGSSRFQSCLQKLLYGYSSLTMSLALIQVLEVKRQNTKICFTFSFSISNYIFSHVHIAGFLGSTFCFYFNQMASALFCFIGTIGRGDLILANTFGSFALVMQFALGGFVLSKGII